MEEIKRMARKKEIEGRGSGILLKHDRIVEEE